MSASVSLKDRGTHSRSVQLQTKEKTMNVYNTITAPKDAVYIGRGSRWGNPFVIGKDGDRAEVIAKYKEYAIARIGVDMHWMKPLIGKNLMCFCAPLACHGDVLLKMIGE